MTPQTENHLQSTSNDADYDQLLGQAEQSSILLQSSLLRNPWFLKEVIARLQRNEDEASSDDESFVSITEVSFADPNMAEIHKAHKPASDPLEPRVTRSKSRSLNIDDLIKGTEVITSPSDSESDAEPGSDAPRGLVTAVNKKWKRPRVKFKKARVSKTRDPSLPPTPTNITEALHGPQRAEWAAALDHEMDRLKERNTFEVCKSVDQLNDKLKPVKSKFAFRVTRKPDGSIKHRCRLVACGYSKIYGVNYNKTFRPTAKWKPVCSAASRSCIPLECRRARRRERVLGGIHRRRDLHESSP
jgi:hypothetical protein